MSGHSKWSTIKRQKGAQDIKRGQVFTKLSKAITLAVKQGGNVTDPAGNPRLRLAIDAARSMNMPKDNIERAIKRAVSKESSEMYEVVYEGFGPGGFSVIVEAVTDNKLRTNSEIRLLFEKNGGSFASPGAVAYQFEQKGLIVIEKQGLSIDDVFLTAADLGAEDVEDAGMDALVYTQPDRLGEVRDEFMQKTIFVKEGSLIRRSTVQFPISDLAQAEKALKFIEKLEDHDDVQVVFTNFDIPDQILQTAQQ